MKKISISELRGKLTDKIRDFNSLSFLVIGDLMLDHYIWGDALRISPEAPVPVVDVSKESLLLGGASNVANNLKAMGANVILSGLIGDDNNGNLFFNLLKDSGIEDCIVKSRNRPTTVKTRIIARQQQLVRFDRELKRHLLEDEKRELVDKLQGVHGGLSGIIVSDYAKGVVTQDIMTFLLNLSKNYDIPIFVDPKPQNIDYYKFSTVITPNQYEAEMMSGIMIRDPKSLYEASATISRKYNIKSVLVTRGADGMAFYSDSRIYSIPTMAKEVFDVTGAGDTSIASFSLAYVSGLDFLSSVIFSNMCAGIVVSKLGTSVVNREEIFSVMEKLDSSYIIVEEKGEDG